MNALTKYLTEHGEALSAFAMRIGRSPSTLTRVIRGERFPSVALAMDVEKGTGGSVPAHDFISLCIKANKTISKTSPKRKAS